MRVGLACLLLVACGERAAPPTLPLPERSEQGAQEQRRAIVLRAGGVFDGTKSTPGPVSVLVRDKIIAALGDVQAPEGAVTIDLGDAFLLPGLIDVHVHPMGSGDDYQQDHIRRSSGYKTLRGYRRVRDMLEAGWTTVRIAGDVDTAYGAIDLRRAIEDGLVVGPRVVGAAHYLSITGGGGDINHLSPEQGIHADGRIVNSPEEMRRAVREEVKHGSDWLKLLVTGAFMSSGDNPKNVHFSPEELAVARDEARRLGIPIMAHAHSAEGIKQALAYGARSIEHGTFIDEEGIRLLRKTGAYLVPTLYIGEHYLAHHQDSPHQEKMLALTRKYRAAHHANVAKAIRAEVNMAVGTDSLGFSPVLATREIAMLSKLGLGPSGALRAATVGNATLLGMESLTGSVQVGMRADLIAVPKNPTDDLSQLEQVVFVMRDGKVIKAPQANAVPH